VKYTLIKLLHSLRPVKTKYPLIRVGGKNDGGYLLPDDLSGVTRCFSPGVAETFTFERDLLNRGIWSHLADASVDMPMHLPTLSFEKKFLGAINDDTTMTLEHWVRSKPDDAGDFLLQMDIEGSEYETIIATPIDILRRFRIIVLEVHHAEYWFNNPIAWDTVHVFFAKLLQDFNVVHLHPNNNCPFIEADGILLPTVFEISLLRKDRAVPEGYCTEFPHPLDQPNVLDKPDRPLPVSMYGEAV
jgi:hypothetical protein